MREGLIRDTRFKASTLILRQLKERPAVKRRLLATARHIETHPDALYMAGWACSSHNSCGTSACLMGWYGLLHPDYKHDRYGIVVEKTTGEDVHVSEVFLRDIGIDNVTCSKRTGKYTYWYDTLIDSSRWPKPFAEAYAKTSPESIEYNNEKNIVPDPIKAAKIAAKRIRHFVRTGE